MEEEIILKRKIYDELLKWKKTSNGKSSLLIEGARRVGKSTIVKEFGKNEYKSFIYIDFEKQSDDKKLLSIFEDTSDLNIFFNNLSVYTGVTLYERDSLIIFDEVQSFPRARSLSKYIVEDGRYDCIKTGSLIRLKKNIKNIVIPSEEDSIFMYPLDFEEFLWSQGNFVAIPNIKAHFDNRLPMGVLHHRTMRLFREYMLVGGMPQAVIAYRKNKDFEAAENEKRKILKIYHDDIYKADNPEKIISIYDNIPSELKTKEKRFIFTNAITDARYEDLEASFTWLNESMIVNNCNNVTEPSRMLSLSKEKTSIKCYNSDTGLLITQCFSDKPFAENELYKAVLFDRLGINEGMLVENIVAQTLKASGHKLYFHSKVDHNKRKNNIEIDFLITEGNKVAPIEVKGGRYNSHVSLDKFMKKYKKNISNSYIIHTKDLKVEDGITYIPIYMTMFL